MEDKQTVVLKQHHCLKGRDVLPVVLRLQQLENVIEEDLACFKKKYSLSSYTSEDLAREFERLTGYSVTVSLLILTTLPA